MSAGCELETSHQPPAHASLGLFSKTAVKFFVSVIPVLPPQHGNATAFPQFESWVSRIMPSVPTAQPAPLVGNDDPIRVMPVPVPV
jgi:hypothetical protein